MASATSKVSKVKLYTGNKQQILRGRGSSTEGFYKTDATTLGGGGLKKEVYRTDEGNDTCSRQRNSRSANNAYYS